MNYCSTRDPSIHVTASQAILNGISAEGGLFVPQSIPSIELKDLNNLSYPELAAKILGLFLTDYSQQFLLQATSECYGEKFKDGLAKTVKVADGLYTLELWHGPTCAFKDYALQLMPRLLVEAKRINNDTRRTIILVATSGDTGKAALEGYKNLPGIEIAVFYPQNGTSEIQRLQMTTQEGDNVHVYAVDGNFDDAQTGVKHVFANTALAQELALKNCHMTSANSINWGRLAPQIVYYFASYLELCRRGEICSGTPVDFCVPTGNFGDILAGYYAKQMGLPIHQLICASNQNCVLTDFGQTGTYNAARKFYKTASPSMDILVSSNLERLLFHESGDTARVAEWMRVLMGTEQSYTIDNELREKISKIFRFGCTSEEECFATLASVYRTTGYLADPHTAVALHVAQQRTEPQTPCVVLSTANPYKFSAAVLTALGESATENDFNNIAQLQRTVGTAAPKRLRELQGKDVRFTELLKPTELLRVAKTL